MSRYYCPECGTEYNVKADMHFPLFCTAYNIFAFDCKTELIKLPDYETPDQYKKRTGKKWNGATFVKCKSSYCSHNECFYYENSKWYIMQSCIQFPIMCIDFLLYACAQLPEPPPDGWRPKEVEH